MKLPRRTFLHLAAGAVAPPALSHIAWAQAYPARPVRVIVPFSPGGPADVLARMITQKLSQSLGQQFYVENLAGAGGNLGMGAGASRWLYDHGREYQLCRQPQHVPNNPL
jgi:tripartite-type tricarboxylate transporter receptor subunit TctC